MGGGDLISHMNFHLHMPHIHHHHHGGGWRGTLKGSVAITVGQGAEQQRFVIPVMYVNHPLFTQLLKEAEEEYGFDHEGAISIPCHVEEFRQIRDLIDDDATVHHHHDHHRHFLCFGA